MKSYRYLSPIRTEPKGELQCCRHLDGSRQGCIFSVVLNPRVALPLRGIYNQR